MPTRLLTDEAYAVGSLKPSLPQIFVGANIKREVKHEFTGKKVDRTL
jgi:hypothetical protein